MKTFDDTVTLVVPDVQDALQTRTPLAQRIVLHTDGRKGHAVSDDGVLDVQLCRLNW